MPIAANSRNKAAKRRHFREPHASGARLAVMFKRGFYEADGSLPPMSHGQGRGLHGNNPYGAAITGKRHTP